MKTVFFYQSLPVGLKIKTILANLDLAKPFTDMVLLYSQASLVQKVVINIFEEDTFCPSQKKFHYQSHAIGGLLGGSVVSYLYHGKPTIGGVMLLTPIMLCIGKLELVLDGYKNDRLQQLRLVSEADNSDNVYHDDGKST